MHLRQTPKHRVALHYGRYNIVRLLNKTLFEHVLSYSFHLTTARIVSRGNNVKTVAHKLSETPPMISFNSLLPKNLETRLAVEVLHATQFQAKHTSSQVIEPSKSRASSSVSVYPGADVAECSFMRHHKYFFKDRNIIFLVREIQS